MVKIPRAESEYKNQSGESLLVFNCLSFHHIYVYVRMNAVVVVILSVNSKLIIFAIVICFKVLVGV
jgi:hypothetical protein